MWPLLALQLIFSFLKIQFCSTWSSFIVACNLNSFTSVLMKFRSYNIDNFIEHRLRKSIDLLTLLIIGLSNTDLIPVQQKGSIFCYRRWRTTTSCRCFRICCLMTPILHMPPMENRWEEFNWMNSIRPLPLPMVFSLAILFCPTCIPILITNNLILIILTTITITITITIFRTINRGPTTSSATVCHPTILRSTHTAMESVRKKNWCWNH